MKKLTKISLVVALIVATFSLAYTAPTYAESCDAEVEECDIAGAVNEVEGEGEIDAGEVVDIVVSEDEGDEEEDAKLVKLEESEDGEADTNIDTDIDVDSNDAVLLDEKPLVAKAGMLRTSSITLVNLIKFAEVGETITITDELADSWGYSSGGISFGVSVLEKGSGSTEPITITQGDGGVFTIVINDVGSYNVWFYCGEQQSTNLMINAVHFTETDDPTLTELIENFKTAMKAIEEAINTGDSDAMQEAWQGYADAMTADATKFYGLDEYDQMTALMRVMSMLIYGEDVVVEQYVYEYTEEDYEYIYEYDAEYAAILDELKGVLAEAGYTENISVYDFDLAVYNNSEEPDEDGERYPVAWLNNLSSEREIVIEADSPEEGYERRYIAARAHFEGYEKDADGNYVYDENGDWIPIWSYDLIDHVAFDAAAGLLSVWSDKFSIFAVSYTDVLVPKTPNTGVYTVEGGTTDSSSLSTVFAIIALTAVVGAVKFAKCK